MGDTERIPLASEEDKDAEPFTGDADHIRARQEEADVERSARGGDGQRAASRERRQTAAGDEEEGGPDREDLIQRGVEKVVARLREKGKSEAFIDAHRDAIRERVRKELD